MNEKNFLHAGREIFRLTEKFLSARLRRDAPDRQRNHPVRRVVLNAGPTKCLL
jgi:hypothetical protein